MSPATETITAETVWTAVARGLHGYCDVPEALINPEARLAEDLDLDWTTVDNFFADIADWSPFDWAPKEVDYWTIFRGLDRHYVGPYRLREAKSRARVLARWCLQLKRWPLKPRTTWPALEPLTAGHVAKIVEARRYICPQPVAGLEQSVVALVGQLSAARSLSMSRDLRLREDLKFTWPRFHALLVAIDDQLEGAFCSITMAQPCREAFVYWQAMEHIPGTPSVLVGNVIDTVRENRWVNPKTFDWTSSIPGDRKASLPSEEQLLYAIKWILVEWGARYEELTRESAAGGKFQAEIILERLEDIFRGTVRLGEDIRNELRSSEPTFRFVVDDVLQMALARKWVEPRQPRWLARIRRRAQ